MKISYINNFSVVIIFIFTIFTVSTTNVFADSGHGGAAGHTHPPGTTSGQGTTFQNPLGFNNVESVLNNVMTTVQSIVGVLAVLFIVIGGIIYMTSGGNQQRTELAKTAIWGAVIGLALALAAPSFIKEIYEVLGTNASIVPAEAQAAKTLSEIALDTLRVILGFAGTISILMLVVGGILYITSAGDDNRTDMAKKTITYAIIGLVVVLLSLVIVTAIANTITPAGGAVGTP